jgi:hypothetical protein
MTRWPLPLLAALTACGSADRGCEEGRFSEPRVDFRNRLAGLVHVSQCPTTTPLELAGEEARLDAEEHRLIMRIAASELAWDLEEAGRMDAEFSRNANEADCVGYRWTGAEAIRDAERGLRARAAQLRAFEARFERLLAQCGGREGR